MTEEENQLLQLASDLHTQPEAHAHAQGLRARMYNYTHAHNAFMNVKNSKHTPSACRMNRDSQGATHDGRSRV